ncbi:MAG: hypothetical protein R3F34_19275 [Planctomycetota bacterium]
MFLEWILDRWRALRAPRVHPAAKFVVELDDAALTVSAPGRTTTSIRWEDVERVVIETSDRGPFVIDLWWRLEGRGAVCRYPLGATGEKEAVDTFATRFPGFDFDRMIIAMGSVEDAVFVCWERSTGGAEPREARDGVVHVPSSDQALVFSLRDDDGFVDGRDLDDLGLANVPATTVALRLEGSRITDAGVRRLPQLDRLRCIDLDSTAITDAGLADLVRFRALEEVWLEDTLVTPGGVAQLRSLPRLRFVSVAHTSCVEAIDELREQLPGVLVEE